MVTNLHTASSQWAARPADERFWSLTDMHSACVASREASATAKVAIRDMRAIVGNGSEVGIEGANGNRAALTHYAFGQLASTVSAPASYLRTLPAPLAAEALNVGLSRIVDRSDRSLLLHRNGRTTVRAVLSEQYERAWDADVTRHLLALTDAGWRAPAGLAPANYDGPTRAATAADILPGQINIAPGSQIAPSGLYASDHDMFAFLVAPDRVIDDGAGGTLMRGVFVKNSEVGDSSLSVTFFLMQAVCGNHIVWNATGVHEIRVRHTGDNPLGRAFRGLQAKLIAYRDGAAGAEENAILAARNLVLGADRDEVIAAIVKYAKAHSLPISAARAGDAFDVAEKHVDWYGNPRTLWAQVAGLTHASQGLYQDDRAAVDRAAGKLLEMAR